MSLSLNLDDPAPWLRATPVEGRLPPVLALCRNIVPIVAGARCSVRVDWSAPDAPYEGLCQTRRSGPIQIRLNPRRLTQLHGHESDQALRDLLGHYVAVALHEAAHIAYTPRRWSRTLAAARRARPPLPDALALTLTNWVEDLFIEGRLLERFPGFAGFFASSYRLLYPDARCQEVRQVAAATVWETPLPPRCQGALYSLALATVAVGLFRPETLPGEAVPEALQLALRHADRAGAQARGTYRIEGALDAAEALWQALGNRPVPARTALPRWLPLSPGPWEARPLDGPVFTLAVPSLDLEEGAVSTDHTVRVVEATPETLPGWQDEYHGVTARLRVRFAPLRHRLRRKLRWQQGAREERLYPGLRSGELDPDALSLAAIAQAGLFREWENEPARGMDLVALVDESGSMREPATEDLARWEVATLSLLCLEEGLRGLDGVRFRVFGFTSDAVKDGETLLFRRYDSARATLARSEALGWGYPKSNNADGVALAGLLGELARGGPSPGPVAVLMLSDGEPSAAGYGGEAAREDVRRAVASFLERGIGFAHLQIGEDADDAQLSAMYGERWERVSDPSALPDRLADLALAWLSPAGAAKKQK